MPLRTEGSGAGLFTILTQPGDLLTQLDGALGIPPGERNGQGKLKLFQLMFPFKRQ
jgi:hypothetical protein